MPPTDERQVLRPTLLVMAHGFEYRPGAAKSDWEIYANKVWTRLQDARSPTTTMMIDWNSSCGAIDIAAEDVAEKVRTYLSARTERYDVLLFGHSRGAILINAVSERIGHPANVG